MTPRRGANAPTTSAGRTKQNGLQHATRYVKTPVQTSERHICRQIIWTCRPIVRLFYKFRQRKQAEEPEISSSTQTCAGRQEKSKHKKYVTHCKENCLMARLKLLKLFALGSIVLLLRALNRNTAKWPRP